MKKFMIIVAVIVTATFSAKAQDSTSVNFKPTAWQVTSEVFISPVSISYTDNENDIFIAKCITLPLYGLKLRLFAMDNLAIRLQLGFNTNNYKNVIKTNISNSVQSETTTNFNFLPGIEYHFKGTKRLSPYVGAELGLRLYSENTKTIISDETTTTHNTNCGFVFNILTGFDYYVSQHLYLGAEIGLGLNTITHKDTANSSAETVIKDSSTSLGLNAVPALRMGWVF